MAFLSHTRKFYLAAHRIQSMLEKLRHTIGRIVYEDSTSSHEEVGEVTHVPETWKKYVDAISGKELIAELIQAARQEKLKAADDIGVWEVRPVSECIEVAGGKPTKVMWWVDVNKGDTESPNVRSRIVAKDFKVDARPELFAATPPFEYVRYLVPRCASSQRGPQKNKLMVQDAKKAYLYAPATRDVYVDLPPERYQPGMCAKLLKSLYVTRDAALNWAQAYSEVLQTMGFVKGLSSLCSFFHQGWGIRTVVHGDDFLSEGPGKNLEAMDAEMRKSFALKIEILGGDPGDVNLLKVLNRQISWKNGEIHWEADPRHVEIWIFASN